MADSRTVQIHKQIVSIIAQDYTGASYYSGLDMTEGNVIRGKVDIPPMIPFATVGFRRVNEDYGPTLGRFQGDIIFEAFVFVGGSAFNERLDNALNLCSDMVKKITANRQLALGSLVDDVKCDIAAGDGEEVGMSNTGIGLITITVKFQSDDGA
tara:strand:+ start:14438 stop:14899 length:462 start_codon:yes stop_codon:yes gene_type:complete